MSDQPNVKVSVNSTQQHKAEPVKVPTVNAASVSKYYEYIGRLYVDALQLQERLGNQEQTLQARTIEVQNLSKQLQEAEASLAALQALQPKTELSEDGKEPSQ